MKNGVSTVVVLVGLAGALFSAPALAVSGQAPEKNKGAAKRSGHTARPAAPDGPLTSADVAAIASRWGVRIDTIRVTAAGYMLDFRYSVVDARKAKPLFERKTKPVLTDETTGARMQVPVPPKTGALRNSNPPIAGKTYFMFFANPGRFIKPGNLVTVTIGDFSVSGIRVDAGSVVAVSTPTKEPAAP